MTEIECNILIDADGNWCALDPTHSESDDAQFEVWTGASPTHPTRIITVKLTVPTPKPFTVTAKVKPELMPETTIGIEVN